MQIIMNRINAIPLEMYIGTSECLFLDKSNRIIPEVRQRLPRDKTSRTLINGDT